MLEHDLAGAQALDTGQLDIIAGQLVHHVAAGPQSVACDRRQRQADDGQHAGRADITGGVQRGETQVFGAEDQHQRIGDQRRHSVDENGVGRADPVKDLVLEGGLQDAQHDAHQQRDAGGDQAEAHGDAEFLADDLHDGSAILDAAGSAEVQMEQVIVEVQQLGADGVGQTGGFQCSVFLLFGKLHELFFREVVVRRQAAHQQKDDGYDQ